MTDPTSGHSVLLLGGLLLAIVALVLLSVAARVLSAAIRAATTAVSAAFALFGRVVIIGLIGVLGLGIALFGGGSDPADAVPSAPSPSPPPAAAPH